ncbi:MAG: M50 family metallopeptidase [Verrucomicrobiales bacterium]|nr:M50 family metallopeptidase [Verrucomicrobiales bacterium]
MLPDDESLPDRGPETPNEWGVMVIIALTFSVLIGLELAKNFTVAKLSVPFFLISWVLLLVIHEFGHALAARFLGWQVDLVCIGTGKVRFRRRILGMPVEFRSIPISGFAQPRPADLISPQLKQCVIYAAGPGIELLLVAVIAAVLGPETMLHRSPEVWLVALQSFCAAAIFGAGFNLIPFPHQTRNGVAWSDGLGMILSWRIPTSAFAERISR